METTKIPLSQCVESSYQNRKELGDVSGLARSIEVNGQITPLIVVAGGEAYQLVAGHRRAAAMRSLGLVEADAYVMDGWDDARIAQILNAENNHRRELTEAERGRGIQTMLSLGVPVADAAVSAGIPEEKAESYVRGTKLAPTDAVNLDFDAVALMGDYDDESYVYQPTPEEVAETEAFLGRKATLDAMSGRIAEFAKSVYPKFPAKGQTKLRQWAYEAFEAAYGCELDDAWEGFKEPKAKALDQFILMRTVPACVPDLPQSASSSAATSRGRAIWKPSASTCQPATDRRSPRVPSIPYDLPRERPPSARPVLGAKLPEGATP